ncbi:MAG: MBL fold metallo-hydrolase [Kiritimatiellae bacterium]|nr:MBL fold metallo-hydrolase [Kiritimatiellia bacterium]
MTVTFLGTGTSVGIPMIGCHCPVCESVDPRNRRSRSCFYVQTGATAFVIDTPPDFRQQMLDARIERVDAVVFTHAHADHLFGFDDIRRFNTLQNAEIPAYAVPETLQRIQTIFDYIGRVPPANGLFRPRIRFEPVEGPFMIGDVRLTPLDVEHGVKMTGFLLEHEGRRVGYVCDCKRIPDATMALLRDLDVMVIDALRERPHPTHMCVEEALACLAEIGARRSYLTHLSHDLDHETLSARLPEGVAVSYDGLRVAVGE